MKSIIIKGSIALSLLATSLPVSIAQNEVSVPKTEKKIDVNLDGSVYDITIKNEGDEVNVTIKGEAIKGTKSPVSDSFRKEIAELVGEMKTEIAKIKNDHIDGKLTKEQMAEQIAEVAREYTEEIEVLVEEINTRATVETSVSVTPKDSLPRIERDEESIRIKVKGKPKKGRRTYSGFSLAFGWHTLLLENQQVEGNIYPEINFWQGGFSEIAYMLNTRIGSTKSPLYLNYGASLVYNRADISGGDYFLQNNNGPMFVDRGLDVRQSRLRTAYVNGTIGFRVAPTKRKGFHMEANAYGGVLFRTKQVIEYRSETNERVNEERVGNYGVNTFNYGISGAIGYNWVSVYARYDLSSLFNNNSVYDYTPLTVGFRFNLM